MAAGRHGCTYGIKTMMNLKKKLQNPLVLVVQGFVAGSVIFYATLPQEPASTAVQPQSGQYQALEKIVQA